MTYPRRMITRTAFTPTGPAATGSAPGIWRLDEVAYWKKQGLWPDPAVVPDPYFPYVSLLLSTTSLSNANNNLLVDSSGAFSPVSRLGNTTQGSLTPFSTNWSNYFDGSGDYLTLASNAAFGFDSGNFTIEGWFFFNNANETVSRTLYSNYTTFSSAGSLYWGKHSYYGGNMTLWLSNYSTGTPLLVESTLPPNNQWVHYALVRSGNTFTLYRNGVSTASATFTGAATNSTCPAFVAAAGDALGTYDFPGYISNFRIVKGTALYTSNFTPPTAPLTAISGTSLLTCQSNRFRDASSNNFTVTAAGNTSVQDFGPFSPTYPGLTTYNQSDITNWSGFFDGSGDFLSTPNSSVNNLGTADFTIELWFQSNTGTLNTHACLVASYSSPVSGSWAFKASSGSTGYIQFASYGPSWNDWVTTTNIAADRQWHHCAVTRSGNTLRIFVDGTVAGTWNISGADPFTGGGHPLTTGFMAQDSTSYLNGNVSNVRIVKGTALYTSAFTPPTAPLTAVSGTAYLTCQNAAFTDNSANNLVLAQNGNPTVTGNSPFQPTGYWSLAGSTTQGATIPQTTATDLGAGSFTLECWVNIVDYTGYSVVTKRRTDTALTGSWGLTIDTNGLLQFMGVGWATVYNSSTPVPRNRWVHLAVVRNGTSLAMFIDGVRVATATDSYDYTCSTYTIIKLWGNSGGNYPAGSALTNGLNGAISNLRIVQGTAVYNPASSAITVPTSPLTAVSGTSLLTCQNGSLRDNSVNNNTSILSYGGASAQPFDPFYTATTPSNGGSLYFDGSGDYVTTPSSPNYALGTSDFIVETWVYPTAQGGHGSGNNDCLIDFRPGTGGGPYGTLYLRASGTAVGWYANTTNVIIGSAIPNNAWSHLMVSRSNGNTRMFINGVQTGSTYADSTNYLQGPVWLGQFNDGAGAGWFQGYMFGARVVKGTGVASNFTPPTAPRNPDPNTVMLLNGMNAGIYDATTINDMETVGNAQVSTVQSKFGGSSVYFDGSGDYLSTPSNPAYALSGTSFTIEAWVYVTSSSEPYQHVVKGVGSGSNNLMFIDYSGGSTGVLSSQSGGTVATRSGVTLNTWHHLAVVRNGTSVTCYVNGVGGTPQTIDPGSSGSVSLLVGYDGGTSPARYFSGYMDDLRVTKGVARYTANFTPPTQPFPVY